VAADCEEFVILGCTILIESQSVTKTHLALGAVLHKNWTLGNPAVIWGFLSWKAP